MRCQCRAACLCADVVCNAQLHLRCEGAGVGGRIHESYELIERVHGRGQLATSGLWLLHWHVEAERVG